MADQDGPTSTEPDGSAAGRTQAARSGETRRPPRVVRRRDPAELTAEERAFLARQRADRPPHHDSTWG